MIPGVPPKTSKKTQNSRTARVNNQYTCLRYIVLVQRGGVYTKSRTLEYDQL